MKYRQTLYSNYHSTQSGRASLTDAKQLFLREVRQFENEIIPLLASKEKSVRIFDLGCGSGSLLKALENHGYNQAVGMDVSQEQVELAHSLGVTQVQLGDGMSYLRENPQQFDVILGMDIIEHFTKDELVELLTLIKDALKPNGLAIFRTPNLDAPMATVFANGDFTHENYLNASSVQQVVLAVGYQQVSVVPSYMKVSPWWKEIVRNCMYRWMVLQLKLKLFATARSTRNIVFSPNMVIIANN